MLDDLVEIVAQGVGQLGNLTAYFLIDRRSVFAFSICS
jgi:hypothetical protein